MFNGVQSIGKAPSPLFQWSEGKISQAHDVATLILVRSQNSAGINKCHHSRKEFKSPGHPTSAYLSHLHIQQLQKTTTSKLKPLSLTSTRYTPRFSVHCSISSQAAYTSVTKSDVGKTREVCDGASQQVGAAYSVEFDQICCYDGHAEHAMHAAPSVICHKAAI
eukprot:1155250-Pelagomonas_calceolata.AAC.1